MGILKFILGNSVETPNIDPRSSYGAPYEGNRLPDIKNQQPRASISVYYNSNVPDEIQNEAEENNEDETNFSR